MEFSRYKWRHFSVFALMLSFASFVVIYVERPDPVKQNLDRVRMKMTRGSVELIMGPPDIVTEHPLAGHIDVLIFKANGANAEVQIDRESGWVVNKGWCRNGAGLAVVGRFMRVARRIE